MPAAKRGGRRTPSERRRAELARIHILAAQLGMDEDTRREMYVAQTGKDGAAG